MLKIKSSFFLKTVLLVLFFASVFVNSALAEDTYITSFALNGLSQNVSFNPQNEEEVTIEIDMSSVVKVTRVYICYLDRDCNGTKGNYVRYFSPSATTSSVSISWNGKVSTASDALFANDGEYRVMVSFYENGASNATSIFGLNNIVVDSGGSSTKTLNSIEVTTPPTKTSYMIGESLNISGMVVTGTYSDNSTAIEPVVSSNISGFDSSVTKSNQILTILYKNKTTTFSVNISSTTSTSTATTTVITETKIRYVYVSTHSSSEELSDYTSGNTFEISAGRDRVSYVGIPVDFNAKHNKKDNRVDFTWSFGDGTSAKGQEISHVYKNSGDYIVILNSKNGINDAVSRANIKILEPDLSIAIIRDGLEIINKGDYEINIGDWKVSNGYIDTFIPKDTIIASKNKIVIPDNVFAEFQDFSNLSLINQSGNIFASSDKGSVLATSLDNKKYSVSNESLEKILGMKVEDAEDIVYTYKNNMAIDKKIKESKFKDVNNVVVYEKIDNLATVSEVIISTTTESVLKKIIYSPIRGVRNIFGRFYDL